MHAPAREAGAASRQNSSDADPTRPAPVPQVFDIDGHRLPQHRARVEGAPKLARPSSHRWAAADRWLEAGP
jgi:hypothetical protein